MNVFTWINMTVFGYIFYSVIRSKYKLSKRNELKYNENSVLIPGHLYTILNYDDEDLTFGEIETYCQDHVKNRDEIATYKVVKWDDIKSWEYEYVIHINFNHTIYLCITTKNETISVTDVHYLGKMKRNFKKYAKEKQIVNFSNKLELVGIVFSFVIFIAFTYILFFRKYKFGGI